MKRVLAVDTSTWWASLALVEQQADQAPALVAALGLQVHASHAGHVLRSVELLLDAAGWTKSSLDAFVATRGPGSFTGIRVGLGTIRGLGLAAARPCAGVTTLEAAAEAHGPAEADRLTLFDAGRGELYGARYDPAASPPIEHDAPWIGPAARALERAGESGAVLIPGPGTRLPEFSRPGLRLAASPCCMAGAAGRIVLLRSPALPDGNLPPDPFYLRPPDALLK